MLEATKPVFLLMHLFFADPSSDMVAGEYLSQKDCVAAKTRSNIEMRPDATICVPVDVQKYAQIMKDKNEFSLMLAARNPKD